MSYTVGLDFGTHQTKICIEDASNPAQKLYEFLEFEDNDGKLTVLFPSIVQINNDDTISYGFVNDERCKILNKNGVVKPVLSLSQEPVLKIPPNPVEPILPLKPQDETLSWGKKLIKLFFNRNSSENDEILQWKQDCLRLQNEHEQNIIEWGKECAILQEEYDRDLYFCQTANNQRKAEYDKAIEQWDVKPIRQFHFRYFKLATYSNTSQWEHEIEPEIISVWYIAYLLLVLRAKLGEDFYIQTGVPSGAKKSELKSQERKAFAILIAAYRLVERYRTNEEFLTETYHNLLEVTKLDFDFSEDEIAFYGLNVLPEAYAGLSSITQQKRLETGMSLLVDIGGGTTDIAFFTIRENKPDIHAVISFHKGLNFIFEQYIIENEGLLISDVQKIFFDKQGETSVFNSSIDKYKKQLQQETKKMVDNIESSFTLREAFHGLPVSRLRNALKNRPVVFCGGGSVYDSMRTSVLNFTDIKTINKNLLNIPAIKNRGINQELFAILATSYGLSIPLENEIVLTSIEQVFNHIVAQEQSQSSFSYEHGLSDI
ncbi:MAG TPA: hypothetical protein DHV48_07760 [Prolixibacteraceae bacterium]|nr:hypothetical protein [Prolixibacteraceae bacterium]